ncbi:RNA-directed DNA polymerase, eukaryota [Tanacetum coccineum]
MGIRGSIVSEAAASLGCSVMKTPFNYLGIMVGGNMSLVKSWDETVHKLTKRLSKWKLKTLSIGGRLTLLKSVLGSTPIYNMSIFKVPKTVLNKMENLRRNFFNGIQEGDRKITWVKWHTVLAAKKFGGLGVSSFFALNRGLLAKWVWRFLSQDNSLWCQLISAIHGSSITDLSTAYPSTWNSIIKEFNYLKVQGVDVFSHCKIRIGNGLHTRFWKDLWIGDCTLSGLFPRLFALDTVKDISVACKLQSPLVSSFRRNVRGGIEEQQLEHLVALLDFVILSNSNDRWVSDLNGDGVFRVKDVRNLLDEFFLPRADVPTRWVKNIPIKVNIFAWKLALDRLPTRANLVQRNVVTESQSCPLCDAILEDTSHLFFNCSLARDVTRLLCRWWNLGVQTFSSYAELLVWFNSVRLASNLKVILEGVFYVTCGDFGTPSERQSLGWSSEYVLRHGSTDEGRYIPADNVFSYTSGSVGDDIVLDFGNSTLCRKADCVFSYTSDSSEGDIVLDFKDYTLRKRSRYSQDYTYECLFRQSGSVETQCNISYFQSHPNVTIPLPSDFGGVTRKSGSTTNYVGHTDNARRGCPGSSMGRYFMDDNSGFEYFGHKGPVILDFENSAVVDGIVSPLLSEKVIFENVASFKAKGPAYSCNDTSEYLLQRGLFINNLGSEQHLCSTSNSVEPIDNHHGMQCAQWSSVGNYSTNNSYGLRHFGNTSPVILDFQNSAITSGSAQRVSSSLPVLNNMGFLADINSSQPVGDNVGCSCDNRDLARLV